MVKRRGSAFGAVTAVFIACVAGPAAGRAEGVAWSDPGWRETVSRIDVDYARSGLSDTVQTFEFRAIDEAGARAIAVRSFSYDSAFEEMALEDLATVKADGRVIPVDPRAVKDQPSATDVASPYFDERRVKIVAFPGVGLGDSVRGRVRSTGTRARFPGAFAGTWLQAADAPPGTVHLTIAGPADMPLHVAAHGTADVAEAVGDRVVHHVTLSQAAPQRSHSTAAAFDDAARFEASTFPDYAAFAAAMRARNAPMARPDAAIARKAAEIAGDAVGEREKAARLYDWVAANIRYVGIGLDDGGWTSEPATAVLEAGYGDCKAHATLLEALLAAQGVAAHLAVVNAGPQYTLTEVATPNFDHAIVYLPGLDLYLDPTAQGVPFGSLPASLYGKPVLDVDAGRLAAIPAMKPADLAVSTETDYVLLPDGTRRATTRLDGSGLGARLGLAFADWLATQDRAALATRMLTDAGLDGSGTYDLPDPRRPRPSFSLSAPFTITRALDLGAPTTIRMLPLTDPRPGLVTLATGDVRDGDFACHALTGEMSAALALPDGTNLESEPAALHWTRNLAGATARGPVTGRVEVEARAWLDGRTVRSRSRVTLAFSAPLCPASFLRDIRDAAEAQDAFERGGIGLTPFAVSFVTDEGSRFAAGLQASRERAYGKALEIWLPLAEAGEPEAQNQVGELHEKGLGVPRDAGEAFRWYLRSAAQGNPFGQSHVGYCYRIGLGVARNDERAAAWLRRAADQNFAYAEYSLAEMHVQGLVWPADLPLAVSLLQRASAGGYAAAGSQLGYLYQNGKGVPHDEGRARDWYARAAARGEAYADAQLGDIYALGTGVPLDYAKAAFHLRRAAVRDFARAQFELGWMYENGFGLAASPEDAMAWYARAADQGHGEARYRLYLLRLRAVPGLLWSGVTGLVASLGG